LLPQPRRQGDILIELGGGHSHGVPTHGNYGLRREYFEQTLGW